LQELELEAVGNERVTCEERGGEGAIFTAQMRDVCLRTPWYDIGIVSLE
jgi:hypothetical protein